MKIKSIFTLLLSAILCIGCQEDQVLGTFSDLKISSSYITLSIEGETDTVIINAPSNWEFSKELVKKNDETYEQMYPIPDWLNISKIEGKAGIDTIYFNAGATEAGREVELKINSGDKSIFIKVRQGDMTPSVATCKEVLEAPDGKNFIVSGTVTRIVNTTYGNWYLNDGTGEIYIYGTLDADGHEKNFAKLEIEVGDKVTIEGPKSTYNGVVQMKNVTVKKKEKALIKILSESAAIGENGGELKVILASKGKGTYYNIAEECQSWVSYNNVEHIAGIPSKLVPNPADTVIYTFDIAPLDVKVRSGAIKFFANQGDPLTYTFIQGIVDVNIKEFIAAKVDDAIKYRIVGHVTGFNEYNNNFYVKDWSGEVYAYYVETQGIKNIAIGDFVTLVGKRAEYNGTPQMPKGTLLEKYTASPSVSVADFLTKEDSKDVYYKLTGTISEIKNALYGNVDIIDANGDKVYVYGLLPGYGASGDAKKGLVDAKGLKVGDTITIVGNKASQNGKAQVGNAVYLSHESSKIESENNTTE